MTDVLLIHPPTKLSLPDPSKSVLPSLPVGYGMLHIAAYLQNEGYNVTILNLPKLSSLELSKESKRGGRLKRLFGIEEDSKEKIKKIIKGYDPIVIGIELNWLHYSRGAIQLAELSRECHPATPIVLGGTHATLFAEEIVRSYPFLTGVLRGESEVSFASLVKKVEKGKTFTDESGLTFCTSQGHVKSNSISKIITNLDDVPPFTLKNIEPQSPKQYAAAINTCRGPCGLKCIYCLGNRISSLSGRDRFTTNSPQWIVNQMRILIDEGVKRFAFQDELWSGGTHANKTLRSIVHHIKKERLIDEIRRINMVAFPGSLNRSLLQRLARIGVTDIDYGCESGSKKVLAISKRFTTPTMIEDSLKRTVENSILPLTYWMVGFPEENEEDIDETISLMRKAAQLGAVVSWVTPLVVLPETELFENAQKYGVKLRKKTFEDYAAFSERTTRAWGWYPELITHETRYLDAKKILWKARAMRIQASNIMTKSDIFRNAIKKHHSILKTNPNFPEMESIIKESTKRVFTSYF